MGASGLAEKISDLALHKTMSGRSAARLVRTDPRAAAVISLVASQRGVTLADMLDAGRGPARIAGARQLAMYLANTMLGRSLTEIGSLFGRDRTTVGHACRSIEDRRDEGDPVFDAELSRLESAIDRLCDPVKSEPSEVRHARGK